MSEEIIKKQEQKMKLERERRYKDFVFRKETELKFRANRKGEPPRIQHELLENLVCITYYPYDTNEKYQIYFEERNYNIAIQCYNELVNEAYYAVNPSDYFFDFDFGEKGTTHFTMSDDNGEIDIQLEKVKMRKANYPMVDIVYSYEEWEFFWKWQKERKN